MKGVFVLTALVVASVCLAQTNNGKFEFDQGDLKIVGEAGGGISPESVSKGSDSLGQYGEATTSLAGRKASIRLYLQAQIVIFDLKYPRAETGNGIEFPTFEQKSSSPNSFSYRNTTFAPASFHFNRTCTPFLMFDRQGRSMIFSPASNFMVSTLDGDGETTFGCGLNKQLESIPAGFEQKSVLVMAPTIHEAWEKWGKVMQTLFQKAPPSNEQDVILQKFGYWTDNGADYYYNYEPNLGYERTLLAVRRRYQQEGIPLGYMQLDSWWYNKSINDASGKPGDPTKNPKLPAGEWNRYGGTMIYRANPDLFPDGLDGFHNQIGLPLAVHSRWIDRDSPYHQHYQFSGVGIVDPKWWFETEDYLAQSDVVCYEQDWLDHIYDYSPEMGSTVGPANDFTNGMANACRARGLDMQYCMATPRFFLQGLSYSNLTTIRTSDDRFEKERWHNFLYASQFARAVGVWPWCDVFKSGETANMILSVLSAGPVGTGDKLGAENKANILRAVRADGVIVKPDESLLPIDQSYLDEANGSGNPFVTATYTGSGTTRTNYVFAFERKAGLDTAVIPLGQVGVTERSYVYRPATDDGKYANPAETIEEPLGGEGYSYVEIAPVLANGIVVLGDLDQFVPTGKQRMSILSSGPDGVKVSVSFGAGEDSVNISGIAPKKPTVSGGSLKSYDPETKRFVVGCDSNGQSQLAVAIT